MESDERFLTQFSFQINGHKVAFLGIVMAPPSRYSRFEIPFSSDFDNLIGVDKSILRLNELTLSAHGISKDSVYESLEKGFESSPELEVAQDENGISITQPISEKEKTEPVCANGVELSSPNRKIIRACNFMKVINEAGKNSQVNIIFKNLSLNP